VILQPQLDGYGNPRLDAAYRIAHHAGNRWGRPCRQNGELWTGDES
jgi:hypothetical protein